MAEASLATQLVGTITFLLLLAILVLKLCDNTRLPYTVMLVVVGAGLATLAHNGTGVLHPLLQHRISADVILGVLVPTLVFETAYNLDSARLKDNLLAIFTLAVPGILLSTFLIGLPVALFTPCTGARPCTRHAGCGGGSGGAGIQGCGGR